jgi:hypothetical protein
MGNHCRRGRCIHLNRDRETLGIAKGLRGVIKVVAERTCPVGYTVDVVGGEGGVDLGARIVVRVVAEVRHSNDSTEFSGCDDPTDTKEEHEEECQSIENVCVREVK